MRLELTRGTFLRRYKRFFADVEIDGHGTVTAHCPNTGSMKTLLEEGSDAWLRYSDDPKRKLAWTLVLLGVPGGRALVDTSLPNRVVEEAVHAGLVPALRGYRGLRREVRYGDRSRIDLLLEDPEDGTGRPCYVEVKNVTMRSMSLPGRGDFPDAVTERGRKHLHELAEVAERGERAVQLFLLGRTDCTRVGIAEEIDGAYAESLRASRDRGVEVLGLRLAVGDDTLHVDGECAVEV